MFQKFVRRNSFFAFALACISLLAFSGVSWAQTSPLTVELTHLDSGIASVPMGTDVTFAATLTNSSDQPMENIYLTFSDDSTVELAKIDVGTLGANESIQIEYTVDQAVSTFTLNASAAGELVTDGGSIGTLLVPVLGSDSIDTGVDPPASIDIGGVGTPGYWKNHHDVWAHLPTIIIGDYNMNWVCDDGESCIELSNEDALFVLDARNYREGKDKRYTLYRSLTAAWLNIIAGNEDSCIQETVDEAIIWLQEYGNPVEDDRNGIKGNEVKGKYWSGNGNELYKSLDIYNNIGSGCAIDRDSGDIDAATGGYTEAMYARYQFGQLPVAYLPVIHQ